MKNNKQLWFRITMILTPILLLILFEGGLRLFNLFPREPLFLDIIKDGREVIQLNPDVAKRYFDSKQVVVPNLYPETFARNKSAAAFRIFCLGGSTTAGFPFDFQVPFPAQMRILLSGTHPDRQFEVINLGLSAISSFSVLDFVPEVLERQPDLILIYMGHNEFYGAYGSASAISIGQNGSFIRFYLRLQKLRTAQMVRALVSAITPAKKQDPENTTLMEQVIADKKVLFRSDKYEKTLKNFKKNLSLILDQCRAAGTPVLIGNLVSNVKDLPPLGSASLGESDPKAQQELDALGAESDLLLRQGQYQQALVISSELMRKDSLCADVWFRAAKIHLVLGDSLQAARCFLGAKDRDIIRFRASEDINQIIKEAAAAKGARFVDVKAKFEAASPHGIVGREWICDHLHPDPNGYYLMAGSFAEEIELENLIGGRIANLKAHSTPVAVTDLDWDIGLLRIYKLLHRWPFANRQVSYANYKAHGEPEAAKVAYDYLFKHHNWVQAHYAMADIYAGRGDYDNARQEYLAISSYYPGQPEPHLKIANICVAGQDWAGAEKEYRAALETASKKGMIFYQMALAQHKQKKLAAAIQTIQMAIVAPEMGPEQQKMAKYYLAGFFIEVNRKDYAVKVLDDILSSDPNFQPAREMMQKYFIK